MIMMEEPEEVVDGVGVRARTGTTIVCVCRRSAANLSCAAVWRERGSAARPMNNRLLWSSTRP